MSIKLYKKKPYTGLLLKDFSPKKSFKKEVSNSIIYILFRRNDTKLKLVTNEDDRSILLSQGYELIIRRPGSKRELALAKLTLNELILNSNNQEVGIDFYRKLIKHLEILGYSNDSPNKVHKKYIVELHSNVERVSLLVIVFVPFAIEQR